MIKVKSIKFNVISLVYYVFRCNVFVFTLWMLILIASGLVIPLNILFKQQFIDSSINAYNNKLPFMSIQPYLIPIILVYLFNFLKDPLKELFYKRIYLKIRANLLLEMNKKKSKLNYEYIENSDASDLIDRVMTEPEKRVLEFCQRIFLLIAGLINISGTVVIIFKAGLWIGVFLLIVALPSYYLAYKGGIKEYKSIEDISDIKRKSDYLAGIPLQRESAHERKMFGFTDYINNLWEENVTTYKTKLLDMQLKVQLMITTSGIASNVFMGLVFLLFLLPLKNDVITIGYYVSVTTSLITLNRYVSNNMVKTIKSLILDKKYFSEVNKFYAMDETAGVFNLNANPESFESIEFKDVFFKYHGTEDYVLKGFSVKIKNGLHYAIVGSNGAGKTTLIKLMLGLYKINAGDILFNGISINDLSQSEINGYFSVIYQDYAKYFISIRDNIALGNIENYHNNEKIIEASKVCSTNIFVENMKDKYETILGKIYSEGIDISGGQWQKLAIARSFMSPSPVKILDEPTAALDPISESRLYNEYSNLSKNKTTVFITHRLASTKLADKIIVVDDGKVVESGNHEELVAADGFYARMFNSQKKWFSEEESADEQ